MVGESAGDRAKDAALGCRAPSEEGRPCGGRPDGGSRVVRGEQRLADLLRGLADSGFRVLADRGFPARRAITDLLVVGPTGVFVLDAKNWSGRLEVDGTAIRHNGRRRVHEIRAVRGQAAMVAELLDSGGMDLVRFVRRSVSWVRRMSEDELASNG